MADTVRTLSALQALLADTTSGAISPQDLRDAVMSGLGFLYVTPTSVGITLDTDDIVVLATGGASGITLALPQAATVPHKAYLVMKVDAGAGAVTLDAYSTEQINGQTTLALAAQYDGVLVVCSGTAWYAFPFTWS